MINKFLQKNIARWLFVALLCAAAALRLLVAYCQRVYLLPDASGLDDMLMIRAAMRVSEGEWLGAYGGMAIAKNMGFALWLWLLHTLHVPVLLGNAALWVGACGFAAWAAKPLLKGNLARLCLFCFLAFQPVSFAFFNQRVYRDAIFPALSLLFFAGVMGLGLRMGEKRLRGSLVAAVVAGLGLAGAWLCREDGPVLLVYALCGLVLVALFALKKQTPLRLGKIICAALPFVLLGGGILGFSAANAANYGVFLVNDLNQGSFPGAYGAMVAVSQAESGYLPMRPVTRAAREKLYQESPTMALLQTELESSTLLNGFGCATPGEYGGSFYFAVKLAADYAGLTPDGRTAQVFWAQVEDEIGLAVEQGRLKSVTPSRSTLPKWNGTLFGPAAAETGRGVLAALTFQDCNPRPVASIGPPERINVVASYLYSPVQEGYVEGTDQPYYNLLQRIVFTVCDVLIWIYRVLIWPLLALALYALVRLLARWLPPLFRYRNADPALLWALLLAGLLLSFLLRMVVAGWMEVSAFGIGTYIMYLSGGLPPLLLFGALAPALWFGGGAAAANPPKGDTH